MCKAENVNCSMFCMKYQQTWQNILSGGRTAGLGFGLDLGFDSFFSLISRVFGALFDSVLASFSVSLPFNFYPFNIFLRLYLAIFLFSTNSSAFFLNSTNFSWNSFLIFFCSFLFKLVNLGLLLSSLF